MAIGLSKAEVSQKVKTFQENKEKIKAIKETNKGVFDSINALENENDKLKAVFLVSTNNGEKAVYFEDIDKTLSFTKTPKSYVENRLNIADGKPKAQAKGKVKLPAYVSKKG